MNRIVFKGVLDGIVVDRIIRDDSFSMPTMHFHPEYEIYYLLDGARYYFIEDKTYQINKGSLVLVNTMQIHRTSICVKAVHDRTLIELTQEPFSSFFENICGVSLPAFFAEHSGIVELSELGQRQVEALLDAISSEFENRLPNYQSIVMMKIAELLLFVTRYKSDTRILSEPSMSNASKHKRIHDITGYILENYDKVKSLDEISKRFYISKSYLCRVFKEVTGFTIQEYINMHCIKESQRLLESGTLSVAQIAEKLGYGSITNFERMFKKYTETTPLKYRKKMRLITQKVRERKSEANTSSGE